MVSNEDISKRLEAVRRGFDPDTELEKLLEMERPLEWVDNTCIIDFDYWPVKDLSTTIKNMFEDANYRLEEGTPTDGIYGTGSALARLVVGYMALRYRFKIEIYSDKDNTFLKISRAIPNWSVIIFSGLVYGNALYNDTFKGIIDVLKYLQPNYDGYMVCQKCGGYYKLQPGELPEDFDVCQCGGELEYHPSSKPQIQPPKSLLWNTIDSLIPPVTLIILFIAGLVFVLWDNSSKAFYILPLTIIAILIVSCYTLYHFIRAIIKS